MIIRKIREIAPGNLHSASAVEVFNDKLYIAGDALAWLYQFDKNYNFLGRIPLSDDATIEPLLKKVKPDWEAMSIVEHPVYKPQLMVIGSGSRAPQRDVAKLLNLDSNEVSTVAHWPLLYHNIRQNTTVEMNMEGLAQVGTKLVLLNRGNTTGGNYIVVVDALAAFQMPDVFHIIQSAPHDINGVKAGFTGAFYLPDTDTLIYTATAELSDNAYDDGLVVGSAIGYFKNISARLAVDSLTPDAQVTLTEDTGIMGKVESMALNRKLDDTKYEFFAVTDNDDKPGSLYLLSLQF